MAGIVQSFLSGVRQAQQDQADQQNQDWLQAQRDFQAQRQQVNADQQDARFAHDSGRWAGDDAYTDQTRQFDTATRQHTQDRRPIEDQQADSNFALNQSATKQRMQIAGAENARAAGRYGMEQGLYNLTKPNKELQAKLDLSDLQLQQHVDMLKSTLRDTAAAWQQDHNPQHVIDWMNSNVAPSNPATLVKNPDGSYFIRPQNGGAHLVKNDADLWKMAVAMTDPNNVVNIAAGKQVNANDDAALTAASKAYLADLNKNGDKDSALNAADNMYFLHTGKHLSSRYPEMADTQGTPAPSAIPVSGSAPAASASQYKTPQDVKAAFQSGAFGDPKSSAARAKARQLLLGMGFGQ